MRNGAPRAKALKNQKARSGDCLQDQKAARGDGTQDQKAAARLARYQKILCPDCPPFLQKYLNLKILERLKGIGLLCGTDWTPLFHNRFYYSRYDHSLNCALIVWNWTRDKKLALAALLHDVGKIGIPNEIINKRGKLTPEEYDIVKQHSVIGAQILSNITQIPHITDGAYYHHERYDGKGYPTGLDGKKIPEIGRIIAVADAYDAMTSNRSYRNQLPQDVARKEIGQGIGLQFDPDFARIMLRMIDEDKDFKMREML